MLKKFLAKRIENFNFVNNSLVIDINGESLSLLPGDVKDILINRSDNSIVVVFGFDKVIINLKSQERLERFASNLSYFFSREEFLRLKRGLIQKLLLGSFVICPIVLYVYLNHFERFSAVVYFLTGIFLYSVIATFLHVKDLNRFFKFEL